MNIQSDSGRYWRAATYDRYTGNGWISSHNDTLTLNASDPRVGAAPDALRVWVTQTIKSLSPDPVNTLYSAGQPVRFDLPIEIRYSKSISDKGDFGFDLTFAHARRNLREGDTYTAIAALSNADVESLRAIDINRPYPAWFTADYLQLPERVPPRLQTLAQALTEKETTEYDKAIAIEKFVRGRIKYNESVSAPPAGRDGVEYVLFDRPEGYCNYYASAMAVLARLAGIPARVASGYSLDQSENGVYHVLESDSHAWVEVYFPGYGWIEFEPTASKPEIARRSKPDGSQDANAADLNDADRHSSRNADLPDDEVFPSGSGFNFDNPFWSDSVNIVIVVLLAALLASFIAGGFFWRKNSIKMAHLTPAARVYEQMLTRARWLGLRDDATRAATPLENADALAERLPGARAETERIAAYYTREKFGAWKPRMSDRAALEISWGRVRAAWRTALVARATGQVRSLPRAVQSRLEKFRGRKQDA
jgi:transglutaminase-like putative cysteine protease